MIKINNNFFLLIASFLLNSCGLPYCIKTPLDEKDMEWLNIKEGNYIFESLETNFFDTVQISSSQIFNPSNEFIFDLRGCNCWEGDNKFNGIALIDFAIINKNEKGGFQIRKDSKGKPACQTIWLAGFFENNWTNHNLLQFKLNEMILDDCIVADTSNSSKSTYCNYVTISKIVWSKSLGLVYYEYENGDKYQRIFDYEVK